MKIIIALLILALSACSSSPKCANPEGSKVVLTGKYTCQIRTRQVTVGSEMKIPESLKTSNLALFTLEWVEPSLKDGVISLGHFVLIERDSK